MLKRPGFTRKRTGDQRGRFRATPRLSERERLRENERELRSIKKSLDMRVAIESIMKRTFIMRPPFHYANEKPTDSITRNDVIAQARPVFEIKGTNEVDGIELYI